MRHLSIVIAILFLAVSPTLAEPPKTVIEDQGEEKISNLGTVFFQEYHDPGWLRLKDKSGHTFDANFHYVTISPETIEMWEKGEAFELQIRPDSGTGILRHQNKKFYKLYFNQKDHPIDRLLQDCKKISKSYHDACYADAGQLWKTEQNYILDHSHADEYTQYAASTQQSWEEYKKSIMDAYSPKRTLQDGRLYETYAWILLARLERDRYFHLYGLFYLSNSYDSNY